MNGKKGFSFLDRPLFWGFLLILAVAAARLCYIGHLQLAEDEAYYWEWSRSLDWCYYDQGPMLAFAIRAGTWLCGTNEIGVRLAAVLCGLGIGGFFLLLGREIGRPAAGLWMALAANGLLLFSVGGILMMHDTLLAFWWCVGVMAALMAARHNERWWLAAGLASGLACLSKYDGLFLPLALLVLCVWHPAWRRHLASPWLWIGAALGAAVAGGPILGWNYLHGWPSFQHVGALAGSDASRHSWSTFPEFVGSQFGLVTPVLMVVLIAALGWAWKKGRRMPETDALFAVVGTFPLICFAVLSFRTRVEGNWPAPAYLGLVPLAAFWLDERKRLWGRLSLWSLGVGFFLTLVVHIQAVAPFLPIPSAKAQKIDATARLDGWRELAERVEAERSALGPDAFVAVCTYQNAAELGFYLPGRPRPVVVKRGSIDSQYRFWNHPQDYAGRNGVIVAAQPWDIADMSKAFTECRPLRDEVFIRDGAEIRRFRIVAGYRFLGVSPL